jgi:hypothetical protein
MEAIEALLQRVEPPPLRPCFLPIEVLWHYEDCASDPEVIVTEFNKRRPRMALAIRRPDGKKISPQEYSKIRRATDLIVKRLIKTVNSDPRAAMHVSAPRTKTFFKKWFEDELNQAILDLEAQQTLLRLCLSHWKAEAMVTQLLLRRNEGGAKDSASAISPNPFDMTDSQLPVPLRTTMITPACGMAPANAAKRALEFSPGPKSPSASHTQKRSKDDAVPSGRKTASPQGPSGDSKYSIL